MKSKGFFSILVSLAIVAGLITPPLKVNAEEVAPVVATIGETSYTSLKEAVDATKGKVDLTVTMQSDIEIGSSDADRILLDGNAYNFTLDLNGKKIQQTIDESARIGSPIKLVNGATLTVKDSVGTGEIYGNQAGIVVLNDSTFTLQSGELRGIFYGLSGNGTHNNTTININGGKISNRAPGKDGAAIYHPQTGKLNITDGVIIGDVGVQLCAGTASITGGVITGTAPNSIASKEGDGIIPDGAAISVVNRTGYNSVPTLNINGGIFTSQQSKAIMAYTWENNTQGVWENANEKIKISGGTYSDESATPLLVLGNKLYAVGEQYKVAPMATNIQLSPSAQSLEVGNNVTLQTTVTPTNTLDTIEFSSSNKEIATVDNDGKVTAIAPGVATITATANSISATTTLTVVAVPTPTPEKPVVDIPQIDTTIPVKKVTIGIQDSASKEVITNTVTSILDDIHKGKTISTDILSENTMNALKDALDAGKTVSTKVSATSLDVISIDKTTVDKVNTLIDSLAKSNNKKATIAQYLDLSVFMVADSTELGSIHKLNKEIEFTVVLPSDLMKEGRDFYVVRVHNGLAEKVDTVMNENGILTFKTDKFSTYALVYEDTITVPTPLPTPTSPATGMDNQSIPYLVTMLGAIVLFGYTSKQKKTKSEK